MDFFSNLYKTGPGQSDHYSVSRLSKPNDGMAALKAFFPDGEADELNFVIFSTSGVHGTYCTIEEVEQSMAGGEECSDVTFLIVHPRIVHLRYGNAEPADANDIAFLKKLRASSYKAICGIGATPPENGHDQ